MLALPFFKKAAKSLCQINKRVRQALKNYYLEQKQIVPNKQIKHKGLFRTRAEQQMFHAVRRNTLALANSIKMQHAAKETTAHKIEKAKVLQAKHAQNPIITRAQTLVQMINDRPQDFMPLPANRMCPVMGNAGLKLAA